jgi:hypothetical protein
MDELFIPVFILFSLLVPVLAFALLLYAVPVRAAVTLVRAAGRREQAVVISWGMIGFRSSGAGAGQVNEVLVLGHAILTHTGQEAAGERREAPAPAPEEIPRPAGTLPAGELVHLVQAAIGPVGRFGSAFWRQSRFESATGTVKLGLGDPVLTGELCGYYWASRFILLASRVDIRLEPDFDQLVLELDLTVRVKVEHPLLILLAGLALVRDPAMQDAIRLVTQKRAGGAAA